MSSESKQLITDILNLKNDAVSVKKIEDNMYDLSSHIESNGWLGKIGISFSGRAILDPENKIVIYWDMIKKSSSGMGGENVGFSSETFTLSGKERSGSGKGIVPGGEKYQYDYGKVREQMRALAEKNGWKFKTVIIKPKWWKTYLVNTGKE